MNRNNFWIHLTIAAVLIMFAAILGQIRTWENALRPTAPTTRETSRTERNSRRSAAEPEILVRFRPGVTLDEIRAVTARNNDLVEDEIESVPGLVSVDDIDNADAERLAEQYSAMS